MAIRTNYTDVDAIMDGMTVNEADVNKYITGANAMLNEVIGTGTSVLMTEIEKWLTAHMISSTRERIGKEEEAGGAKIKYTGFWSEGLKSTPYGQMVLTLDTTGAFAALGKPSASITAITSFD